MSTGTDIGNEEHRLKIFEALDAFKIEIPSWGFANTGTRFGKFVQMGAATTLSEKFADAAMVNSLTGASPTIALHVLWDLPNGLDDVRRVLQLEEEFNIKSGSINPNLFQLQEYKHGSIANPNPAIRRLALDHLLESARIGQALGSRDLALWIPDGSNYPGSQSMRRRIIWIEEILTQLHAALDSSQRMLIEYKGFEPAFYHTDIADWGMALHFAEIAGPQACVLVDTGHHPLGTNIEQIVTWLQHKKRLGAFHFNDRKYADDDLTLGSIDPYQLFRIFHELGSVKEEASDVAFMIDQSHNLKVKIEAVVQSVVTAQELCARAALIDHRVLSQLQDECRITDAEELLRNCFWADIRETVKDWRNERGLARDPFLELTRSGYVQRISEERKTRNYKSVATYA